MGTCNEWRSCFWNPKTKALCVVYVDDFKIAGPKAAVEHTWKDIVDKSCIGISDPEEITHFLGCKHHVQEKDGVRFIEYDMEGFLSSACDMYEQLAKEMGQDVKWTKAETPFVEEFDAEDLSRHPITDAEDGLSCPFCQGIYPKSCFEHVPKGTANQRKKGPALCGSAKGGATEDNHKLIDLLAKPTVEP